MNPSDMNPFDLIGTTPSEVTPVVRNFVQSFSTNEPAFVPVDAEAPYGRCFQNVQAKVQKDGGRIVYGRVIWLSSWLIEAEWHAVWDDSRGNLIDVTAKRDGEYSILFVPTDEVWDGIRLNPNIRRLLIDNPSLRLAVEALEAVESNSSRASDGRIQVRVPCRVGPGRVGRNERCPCGSGKKFKQCCR